ncbi:MAG: hypothetical protein KDG55_15625 [Rhodocyclaceae bacterium]|nr:hypothetical protein [Rhodocyclaceae bacterium]
MNRFLMGTIAPRIQLDLIPAIACAAHVMLRPVREPKELTDYVRLGGAMQRIWLTVAAEYLYLQPEMTPVIFRWYAREAISFSSRADLAKAAAHLADEFEALAGVDDSTPIGFFCRVGASSRPDARSVRKSVGELLLEPELSPQP